SVYLRASQFWQGYAISSGGTIYGPLQPCLGTLKANEEAAAEVRSQWLQGAESKDDTTRTLAKVLLFALDATAPAEPPVAAEDLEKRLRELTAADADLLTQNMWWELGQVLQDQKDLAHLAVIALEHAQSRTEMYSTRQYEYSVHARLTDAYIAA